MRGDVRVKRKERLRDSGYYWVRSRMRENDELRRMNRGRWSLISSCSLLRTRAVNSSLLSAFVRIGRYCLGELDLCEYPSKFNLFAGSWSMCEHL